MIGYIWNESKKFFYVAVFLNFKRGTSRVRNSNENKNTHQPTYFNCWESDPSALTKKIT